VNDADEAADKAHLIEEALLNLIQSDHEKYAAICNETLETIRQIKTNGYFSPTAILVPYSCSFVENKDSLIHWSMYGGSGQGVAIGFNEDVLRDYLEKTYPLGRLGSPILTPCFYGDIQDITKATIDDYITHPNWSYSGFSLAMSIAFNIVGKYKNGLFVQENETRLLMNQVNENIKWQYHQISNAPGTDGIKFCMVRGIIRSYYEFDLSPMWISNEHDSIICELVIGPSSRQNRTELRLFLDSCNLNNVVITESEIPLR